MDTTLIQIKTRSLPRILFTDLIGGYRNPPLALLGLAFGLFFSATQVSWCDAEASEMWRDFTLFSTVVFFLLCALRLNSMLERVSGPDLAKLLEQAEADQEVAKYLQTLDRKPLYADVTLIDDYQREMDRALAHRGNAQEYAVNVERYKRLTGREP